MTRPFAALLCAATILVISACGGGGGGTPAPFSPAAVASGRTLSGGTLSLASLHGHPVVLVFWASWCGPCHDEQPQLNAAYARWQARGVRFVGVDLLDTDDAALSFQRQNDVPYPSVVDGDGGIAEDYLIPAAPAVVLIASDGSVRLRQLGGLEVLSAAALDSDIRQLLAGTLPPATA